MNKSLFKIHSALTILAVLMMAQPMQSAHAAGIVVTSNADDTLANLDANTTCDLREAITNANDDAATYTDCGAGSGADTITFDIPGAGPHVITVTGTDLPNITAPVTIDGLPNEVGATCPLPTGPLGIQIDAAAIRVDGLRLAAGSAGSRIRGLSITNFDDDGIDVLSSNNSITCNYLGLAADGTTPGGNRWGVNLDPASSSNTVGGSNAGDGNVIAHNTNDGLVVASSNNIVRGNIIRNHADAGIDMPIGTGNRFSQNSIHSNTNLGIDIDTDGVTGNDSGDGDTGANNRQNFPVLSSVTAAGVVNGSLDSLAANTAYPVQIEFFANTSCDSSGHGEGEVYLSSTSIAAPGGFSTTLTLVAGKDFITATAIDNNGNTSEFSACQQVTHVADLTISKTHTGDFTQGQTGAQYTITVTNAGSGSTSGTVTVIDTLPAGLTATALSGSGWDCMLATLTCTREDALAASNSYPDIVLTVNVASNAPASVTNSAMVSGGGEQNTDNNTANDPTTITPQAAPICNGQTATIYVNEQGIIVGGPDNGKVYKGKLNGTSGADVMVGTNGKDTFAAKNGNDLLCGGGNNDKLAGGSGNDTIFGEDGNDIMRGEDGKDTLTGGLGADQFIGGSNTDTATDFTPGEGDTRTTLENF